MTSSATDQGLRSILAHLDPDAVVPAEIPDELSELIEVSYVDLKILLDDAVEADTTTRPVADAVLALRKQAVNVKRRSGGVPSLARPRVIADLLANGRLVSKRGRWLTYRVDRHARLVYARAGNGEPSTVRAATPRFPYASELPTRDRTDHFLVLYGGGPEILREPDVRDKVGLLLTEAPVLDIVLHDRSTSPATIWSLRHRCGARGGNKAEFPDDFGWLTAKFSSLSSA